MRVSGVDHSVNLNDLPFSISAELAANLQVANRWKVLLESLEKSTSQQHFHFSVSDVAVFEQAGSEAAKRVLWKLGSRGMTVGDLVYFLGFLKWEEELRLLKIPERVQITSQPRTKVQVTEGDRVSLKCKATGFPYPRYEWLVSKGTGEPAKPVEHPSAICSQLVIPCVTTSDAGKYICRVLNDYSCEDSLWVKLKVAPGDPVIVKQRQAEAAVENSKYNVKSQHLTAVHYASQPLSDGTEHSDGVDGPLSNLHLEDRPLGQAHTGRHETGPYITKHPSQEPLHVPVGQPVTFFVEAYGNPPPVYRWYRKHRDRGTVHPVEGGNQPILRIPKVNQTHNGNYYCEVSNHISSVDSKPCQLYAISPDLTEDPKIIYEPCSQSRMVDDLLVMDIKAEGKGPLTYQWFKDGRELPGETGKQLEFRIKSGKDAGSYQCLVSCPLTGGRTMLNKPARLDVKYPPINMQKYRAQDKVALVIGESQYLMYQKMLVASKYDAREMTCILSSLGFKVISLLDPSKEEILRAVDSFCEMLETPANKGTAHHSGMYGVFYWAGHGCHHFGDSYLIPYDVGLETQLDECISVEYIRSKMLRTDPSLCLLLLDMCRIEDEKVIKMPVDYKGHVEAKKVPGRDNDPYGNHCTIYATSVGQQAFETKNERCSVFVQCFKKAIYRQTKDLSELFKAILEELGKHPKADKKQNPDIASNMKQNRTLHDEIVTAGFTDIVHRRQEQWENTHTLPDIQQLVIDSVGIKLVVQFEDFLSNVLIMHVVVRELGNAVQINMIETSHDPQKVHIVDCSKDYVRTENAWHFQISALQRLTTDLHVKIRLQYKKFNGTQYETYCALNLGRPLVAGSDLWNIIDDNETDCSESLGATGGEPFMNSQPGLYGQMFAPQGHPFLNAAHPNFQMPNLSYAKDLLHQQQLAHSSHVQGLLNQQLQIRQGVYAQGLLDQQRQLELAANRICHPEQEDQPGAFPHQHYPNYFK